MKHRINGIDFLILMMFGYFLAVVIYGFGGRRHKVVSVIAMLILTAITIWYGWATLQILMITGGGV